MTCLDSPGKDDCHEWNGNLTKFHVLDVLGKKPEEVVRRLTSSL